ncbi:MAG: MBL fold metallo-hydrolase [Bacteroidota bacterium]
MTIKIWGARGAIPTFGPDTQRIGGNTSCISVAEGNELLILDAGSGIRKLGESFDSETYPLVHIFLTHLHMDHIQGLGFFRHFFNPRMKVHLWGPPHQGDDLQQQLNRYLSPPLFPIRLRDFSCELHLHQIPKQALSIGPFRIEHKYICHPGPTLGYRITHQVTGNVLTYLPDHEPALGVEDFPQAPEWTSGYELAKFADVLIHDAQFTQKEYETRVGWGHSTIDDALKFAQMTEVKHLVCFHHDPNHTDEFLNKMLADCLNSHAFPLRVSLAQEGMTLEL